MVNCNQYNITFIICHRKNYEKKSDEIGFVLTVIEMKL